MTESQNRRGYGADARPDENREDVELTLLTGAHAHSFRMDPELAVTLARELLAAVLKQAEDAADRGEVHVPAQWLSEARVNATQYAIETLLRDKGYRR